MEMADAIVINKADGIAIKKRKQTGKRNSTGHYIFSSQNRVGHPQQLLYGCHYQRESSSEQYQKFFELTKSNNYFFEKSQAK
jgi:putative protein kinase ArgK-like GTPase of G3E family